MSVTDEYIDENGKRKAKPPTITQAERARIKWELILEQIKEMGIPVASYVYDDREGFWELRLRGQRPRQNAETGILMREGRYPNLKKDFRYPAAVKYPAPSDFDKWLADVEEWVASSAGKLAMKSQT